MKTFLKKLQEKSEEARTSINEFLDTCSIYYDDPNSSGGDIYFVNPTLYYWGSPKSEESGKKQIISLRITKNFFRHYNLLLFHFTEGQVNDISNKQKQILGLIQKSIKAPSSIEAGKKFVDKTINKFIAILERLTDEKPKTVLIPDTNSLIKSPDPKSYEIVANQPQFEFLITPTVTKELDKLKVIHRDPEFRKKVSSVIKRIKGYRNQGSLITGVQYQKSIIIRAIANEPKFENLLEWLDQENDDDRLIATVLQELVRSPSSKIILVTSDINLQNKAELAMINYTETP